MVHLKMLYSQLEDQQVAPPTSSLFRCQKGLCHISKGGQRLLAHERGKENKGSVEITAPND